MTIRTSDRTKQAAGRPATWPLVPGALSRRWHFVAPFRGCPNAVCPNAVCLYVVQVVSAGLVLAALLMTGCSERPSGNAVSPAVGSDWSAKTHGQASTGSAATVTQPAAVQGGAVQGGASGSEPSVGLGASDRADRSRLRVPAVVLSDQHAKTCRVSVGDVFPTLTLRDAAGEPMRLEPPFDAPGVLVIFWHQAIGPAREQLMRLPEDLLDHLGGRPLPIVAIRVGTSDEARWGSAVDLPEDVTQLSDPTGEALRKVATSLLPRTYLLDARGRIVWFDLEYSAGMRRDLLRAVRAVVTSSTPSP